MTDDPAQAKRDIEVRQTAVNDRWSLIWAVVDPLLAERQENHFAERIRAAFVKGDSA